MSRREISTLRALLLHGVCVLVGLIVVVPVLFGVLGGFKDNGQLASHPFALPSPWVTENYTDILGSAGFWGPLGNSLLIAVLTTVLVVLASAMAAFVFARYAFRGRELLFTLFTIGLMFPFAVAILPVYLLAYKVGVLVTGAHERRFAFQMSWDWVQHGLGPMWKPFLIGCGITGALVGLVGYALLDVLWRYNVRKKYRERAGAARP